MTAFVIVDVQNDFISGSLSVSNCPAGHQGEEVSTGPLSVSAVRPRIPLRNVLHGAGIGIFPEPGPSELSLAPHSRQISILDKKSQTGSLEGFLWIASGLAPWHYWFRNGQGELRIRSSDIIN